jgi:hypothetical protein
MARHVGDSLSLRRSDAWLSSQYTPRHATVTMYRCSMPPCVKRPLVPPTAPSDRRWRVWWARGRTGRARPAASAASSGMVDGRYVMHTR